MYKQVLFYLMLVGSVSRATAILLLAVLHEINLPITVVLLSAIVAVLGIFFVIKRLVKGLRLRDLAIYHLTAMIAILISFALLHFFPSDVSMIETMITGSVLSVLISGTTLMLAFRKRRYVTIRRQLEEEIEQKSSHSSR